MHARWGVTLNPFWWWIWFARCLLPDGSDRLYKMQLGDHMLSSPERNNELMILFQISNTNLKTLHYWLTLCYSKVFCLTPCNSNSFSLMDIALLFIYFYFRCTARVLDPHRPINGLNPALVACNYLHNKDSSKGGGGVHLYQRIRPVPWALAEQRCKHTSSSCAYIHISYKHTSLLNAYSSYTQIKCVVLPFRVAVGSCKTSRLWWLWECWLLQCKVWFARPGSNLKK